MNTKDITTLSKYLSFCILLLITCGQIAAHTFSQNLYSSIALFQQSKDQTSYPVMKETPAPGHVHGKIKFDLVENEIEEDDECSYLRKAVNARLLLWEGVNYVFSQIFSDEIQRTHLSLHLNFRTSDYRYLILQVFRI
jgi:hypothetical protein